jgi:hypothetical protein
VTPRSELQPPYWTGNSSGSPTARCPHAAPLPHGCGDPDSPAQHRKRSPLLAILLPPSLGLAKEVVGHLLGGFSAVASTFASTSGETSGARGPLACPRDTLDLHRPISEARCANRELSEKLEGHLARPLRRSGGRGGPQHYPWADLGLAAAKCGRRSGRAGVEVPLHGGKAARRRRSPPFLEPGPIATSRSSGVM